MPLPDWQTTSRETKIRTVEREANAHHSAAQIAALFRNASRSAIIGFAARNAIALGSKDQAKPAREKQGRPRQEPSKFGVSLSRPKAAPKNARPPKVRTAPPEVPTSALPFFQVLAEGGCKWPLFDRIIGPVADAPFCGARRAGDGPYCGHHHHLGTEPSRK